MVITDIRREIKWYGSSRGNLLDPYYYKPSFNMPEEPHDETRLFLF